MDPAATMTITLTPPYQVKVSFPTDPILCAFLLSEAKKAVDKYFAEQAGKLVQPATALPGNGM
jgi:hypothetical protein